MRIDVNGGCARDALTDLDHRSPLGELGAEFRVFGDAVREPIQALGDRLAVRPGERLRAGINLDAGQNILALQNRDQRRPVGRRLTDRLVIQDGAADEFAQPGRAEQHLPVIAAGVLGRDHIYAVEPLLDGSGAFVRRQQAPVVRNHGFRD